MNDKTWILVVDDEECVLQLMATVLRIAGHKVSTASDGYSALELCRTATPQLILCDLHLHPSFTGRELVKHLRLTHPDLKALFVSGLNDWETVEEETAFHSEAFLAKPFSPSALVDKVRETLSLRPVTASSL